MAVAPSAPVSARDHHPKKQSACGGDALGFFSRSKSVAGAGRADLDFCGVSASKKLVRIARTPKRLPCVPTACRRGGSAPTLPLPPPAPPAPRPPATPAPPEILHRLGASWGFSHAAFSEGVISAGLTATRSQASRATAGGTAAAATSFRRPPFGHGPGHKPPVRRTHERSRSVRSQPRRAARFPSSVSPSVPLGAGEGRLRQR